MATQIKTIKQRINSIGNIKKITRTMEMVAVAKMKKAIDRSAASREYARYALEILFALSQNRRLPHPLLEAGPGTKTLLVIIASNKGLCGSYNSNVHKQVSRYKKDYQEEIEAIVVGKQAEKIALKNNLPVIASFHGLNDGFTEEEIDIITDIVIKEFTQTKKYRRVGIVYTEFINRMSYKPRIKELLPVSPKTTEMIAEEMESNSSKKEFQKQNLALYLFEPSEQQVLDEVIPDLLSATIFQTLLESAASEHSSRMFAMKNATDNAGQLLDELSLIYNKARQANITQEVAEIIAGAEALNIN